jgi:hypothetical protein
VFRADIRTEVHLPEVDVSGSLSANGTWSGVIGMLVDRTAEVAVGDVTMTSPRTWAVDFSMPLILSRYIIPMGMCSAHSQLLLYTFVTCCNVWRNLVITVCS